MSQLAQRLPSAFRGRVEIAEGLFAALESEVTGVRSQLQTAISTLAVAFKTADETDTESVKNLLFRSVCSDNGAVRLVAVTWSMRLFPFNDCFARYICVIGAGDDRREVRSESLSGLDPSSFDKETSSENASYPMTSQFLAFLKDHSHWMDIISDKSLSVVAQLTGFLSQCHAAHDVDPGLDEAAMRQLLRLHQDLLSKDPPPDIAAVTLEAMVSLLISQRTAVADWCGERIQEYLRWLHNTNRSVRSPAARLIGVAANTLEIDQSIALVRRLASTLSEEAKTKFEVRSGSIQALGYMAAASERDSVLVELASTTLKELTTMVKESDPHLATTAALALSHQLLNQAFHDTLVNRFAETNLEQNFNDWFINDISASVFQHCRNKDISISSAAAMAVGISAKGLISADLQQKCLQHLISLQNIKDENLQCVVGEALALGFARNSISSDILLVTNFSCLRESRIDIASIPSPTVTEDVHGHLIDDLLTGLTHSRSEHRSACCSHLLTIMTYCPRHPSVLSRLERAQNGFLGLLGDKKGFTQQMASRGVSLVYSLGDEDIKSKLLHGLTSVLKDPTKKGTTVKVEADTEVFAEGELGNAPGGGNLTTYKELCALATDMGQPDLLYKFMDLANHQTAINSRQGAVIGFAHIAELASEDLRPYLGTLVPRIYRMQYDPNPAVRETMQNIWKSLVPDGKDSLSAFINPILEELLNEMGSRLWRHRQSSCRAMADFLQGRSWTQLRSTFEQIWTMAFRVADDIKESVRVSGNDLLKSLKRATVRFIDKQFSDADVVEEVASVVLPLLLDCFSKTNAYNVIVLAFATLSEISSSCSAEHLRPHLSLLVPSLLELSTRLDPGILDEVQLMISGIGMKTDSLEAMRVSAASHSPVHEILNRCVRATDVSTLEQGDLTARLKDLIQRGVGLNTRVGTVNFIKQLSVHMGSDFAPFASKFIKALLNRSLSGDLSTPLLKAYASAIGALCQSATDKTVAKLVDLCMAEVKKEGGNVMNAGFVLKELQSNASSLLSNHASVFIPFAFLKRFDTNATTSATWSQILEEGMGTEASAVRLYHQEIVQEVTEAFSSPRWATKIIAAKCIENLYEKNSTVMEQHSMFLLTYLLELLQGRMWDGKESLLKAIASICTQTPKTIQSQSQSTINALKTAATKGKLEFRQTAVDSLAEVLLHSESREQLDDDLVPMLLTAAEKELTSKVANKTEDTEEGTLSLTSVIKCLSSFYSCKDFARNPMITHVSKVVDLFHSILTSPRPWSIKISVLQSLCVFLKKATFSASDFSSFVVDLLKGVITCFEEQKYEQLRLTAIDAMESIRDCSRRHGSINDILSFVPQLTERLNSERSSLVREQLQKYLAELKD